MKKVRMTVRTRMIRTRFLGPTDHRVARVAATNINTKKRKVVSWDHAIGCFENHEQAARQLLADPTANLLASSEQGGGYVFAVLP